jgi:hypothetical protein
VREVTAKEVDSHRVQGEIEFLILAEKVAVNPDTDLLPFSMADLYHFSG